MLPKRTRAKIYPKISTMPRQHTEAAHYLDMYKLTVEKKRLQQELQSLEERKLGIQERLAAIAQAVDTLDGGAQQMRDEGDISSASMPSSYVYLPSRPVSHSDASDAFNTVLLEY